MMYAGDWPASERWVGPASVTAHAVDLAKWITDDAARALADATLGLVAAGAYPFQHDVAFLADRYRAAKATEAQLRRLWDHALDVGMMAGDIVRDDVVLALVAHAEPASENNACRAHAV